MVSDNSPAVSEFTDWCKASLDINVSETKDMIIDFEKNPLDISAVLMNDQAEVVHQ